MSSNTKNVRVLFAAAALTLLASACDTIARQFSPGKSTHDHGVEAEEEGKTAVITVWGDRFEAFIEHDYLIANRPTKFITHISDLVTLLPRREGSITYVMSFGGEKMTHDVSKVVRDGIYLPLISFPKVGVWKVHIEVPYKGKVYKVKLPDFTVYKDEAAVEAAAAPEDIDGITYLKEQQWKIGTGADRVGRRTLSQRLLVSARVSAPLACQAQVSAPFQGALLAPRGGPIPGLGTSVKAGQVLARIRPLMSHSDLLQIVSNRLQLASNKLSAESMRVQVESARRQLDTLIADLDIRLAQGEARIKTAELSKDHAERTLLRVKMLFARKAKSKKDLERSQFELKKAAAEIEVARALVKRFHGVRKSLSKLSDLKSRVELPKSAAQIPVFELKAAIAGVISKRRGVVGELVDPTRPVFTILDPSVVWINARVPETSWPRLAKSHAAFYEVPGAEGVYHSIVGEGGRFLRSGLEVDARTRTTALTYSIPNKSGRLRLGMALTVHLETQKSVDTLAIQSSAIVEEDGQPIAFVHISGETYAKRELTLGIRDGNWVEVKSGLKLNERVVTKGAYNIRLASLSTALPAHGHSH
jgi:membrane fusion protein, heavy metal efflux system